MSGRREVHFRPNARWRKGPRCDCGLNSCHRRPPVPESCMEVASLTRATPTGVDRRACCSSRMCDRRCESWGHHSVRALACQPISASHARFFSRAGRCGSCARHTSTREKFIRSRATSPVRANGAVRARALSGLDEAPQNVRATRVARGANSLSWSALRAVLQDALEGASAGGRRRVTERTRQVRRSSPSPISSESPTTWPRIALAIGVWCEMTCAPRWCSPSPRIQ